jgi:hypothetical protein
MKIKMYKTISLPVILYRCETWSLTQKEYTSLKVFESGVLRKIIGLRGNRGLEKTT